ncbi:MAG: response regulator [Oligoflexia bacterium]|nr:response regulator [Oligoflexia bacterium]
MTNETFQSTILCVDDEAGILAVLERALKNEAARIITTTKPLEAIDIMKKEKIDLAILDIKMPDIDGLNLLSRLKEISPHSSYILLTAFGDKNSIQTALRIGIDDFIDKPFDNFYLKNKVKNLLSKKEYEYIISEVIELLISNFSQLNLTHFSKLSFEEKSKNIHAIMEIVRLKILKKQNI